MPDTLFAGYDPPEGTEIPSATPGLDNGRSAGARRTARRLELIRQGRHPLRDMILHESASRDAQPSDTGRLPYRCGSCVHRILSMRGACGAVPKCDLTTMSHSEASDVRAWWPACPQYAPIEGVEL